jgi:hypothetical protein
MTNERSSLQISLDDEKNLDKVVIFTTYEDGCRGGAFLDIEMHDADGTPTQITDIPEIQIRQLAAYLNALLPQR